MAAVPGASERARGRPPMLYWLLGASCLPFLTPLLQQGTPGGPAYGWASVLGLLGLLVLWWQMVLGIRQVTRLAGLDRAAAVRIHTLLGVTGALTVFLHPLVWRVAEDQDWSFLWRLEFDFVEGRFISFGRLAIVLFLVVWLSSTLTRHALHYRWWRYLHYVTYPMTFLVFIHSYGATGILHENPLLMGYWWVLAAGLAVSTAVRLASPILSSRTQVLRTENQRMNVLLLLANQPMLGSVRPGQFVYLRTRRWGRGHPFSVVDRDSAGNIQLAVNVQGPQTGRLAGLQAGEFVFVDGPYGSFTQGSDRLGERVYIAGGIGITPFVWRITKLDDPARIHLFHLVREAEGLLFRDVLASVLGAHYVPVVGSQTGRLKAADLDSRLLDHAVFFVCGSPGFVEGWQRQLRSHGVPSARLNVESFE